MGRVLRCSITSVASRSAVPLAGVRVASTAMPFLFPMRTCPI